MNSKILESYTNPSNPGALSGISGFIKNNPQYNEIEVKNTLLTSDAYTKHIPPKRNFKRRNIIVGGINKLWQADLIDTQKLKYQNSHYNYILTVIDCFSKYAWAEPIKSKHAVNTESAFKKIIESSGLQPEKLLIDGGNEFKGSCKKYLEGLGIKVTIAESDLKASIVERFNRTLKEKLWRNFEVNGNKKYVTDLPKVLSNYNNSIHSSIQTKPSLVNKQNEKATFKILYGFEMTGGPNEFIEFNFNIGDYVRSVIPVKLFEKGYTKKWSDEVFIIHERIPSHPPTYKIKSLEGEVVYNPKHDVEQIFYSEELNIISTEEFPIDAFKVLNEINEQILVQKLNTNTDIEGPIWVNKSLFLNG